MKVGLAQMAPVLLNKEATINKMLTFCDEAAASSCDLIVFSEAILPGYPFWTERTEGAKFNSDLQKDYFAMYWKSAVNIEKGDMQEFQQRAKKHKLAMYVGVIEKTEERGHSLYCSLVYISQEGNIESVHRKLRPTYDERLFWSPGDGHGLRVHDLEGYRVGGLNCWENWMPMARAALYGQGENVHISVWPGSPHNTEPIIRFLAQEGRSYSIAVGGLMRPEDVPADFPEHEKLITGGMLAKGGSCAAAPDGSWLLEPQEGTEELFTVTLDHDMILRERHNFDAAGHYARPDVLQLHVNRERQQTAKY